MNGLLPFVQKIAPADWPAAAALIVSYVTTDEAAAHAAALADEWTRDAHAADGLFGAYVEGRLVGAAFTQVLPGQTASVWMPRATPNAPTTTRDSLLQAVISYLHECRVQLAQALLPHVTVAEEAALRRWGFARLSDLLYLVCQKDEFPQTPPVTTLTFEPFMPAMRDRLSAIVAATYRETRDFPQLNKLRAVDDVLDGYRATGESGARLWFLIQHSGRDVGCLLLADQIQHDNLELVYMGIVPAARGAGWGIEVARQAEWLAHMAGRSRVVLAVAAENAPAVRMYAAAGFQAWDRRHVFVLRVGAAS